MKRLYLLVGFALALTTVAAIRLGGWAVVTVENPPEYLVAGKPLDIDFTVRQHGRQLLGDLKAGIEAKSGMRRVAGTAWALQRTGGYRATITVPQPGEWQLTINSGFGRSRTILLPLRAIESTARPPAPLEEPERGRVLFAAKGCVTCHVHGGVDITGDMAGAGPDLTGRRFPGAYLEQFLADPSIKPPTATNGVRMPNLALRRTEIASLIAFINAERKLTSR
jgi:mono/diheme cytochrome c family protein